MLQIIIKQTVQGKKMFFPVITLPVINFGNLYIGDNWQKSENQTEAFFISESGSAKVKSFGLCGRSPKIFVLDEDQEFCAPCIATHAHEIADDVNEDEQAIDGFDTETEAMATLETIKEDPRFKTALKTANL